MKPSRCVWPLLLTHRVLHPATSVPPSSHCVWTALQTFSPYPAGRPCPAPQTVCNDTSSRHLSLLLAHLQPSIASIPHAASAAVREQSPNLRRIASSSPRLAHSPGQSLRNHELGFSQYLRFAATSRSRLQLDMSAFIVFAVLPQPWACSLQLLHAVPACAASGSPAVIASTILQAHAPLPRHMKTAAFASVHSHRLHTRYVFTS